MTDPTPDVDAALGGPMLYAAFILAWQSTNDVNAAQGALRDALEAAREDWTVDELFALLVENIAERAQLDRRLARVQGAINYLINQTSDDGTANKVFRSLLKVATRDA